MPPNSACQDQGAHSLAAVSVADIIKADSYPRLCLSRGELPAPTSRNCSTWGGGGGGGIKVNLNNFSKAM